MFRNSESWLGKVAKPLADSGMPEASYLMGSMLERATGKEKDLAAAVEYYTEAAEKGFAYAQVRLGLCHLEGRGTPKDRQKAEKWFSKAADEGEWPEIVDYARALLFYHGLGKGKDESRAAKILRESVENNNWYGPALLMLGDFYAAGKGGLTKDLERAREFYERGSSESFKAAMKAGRYWNEGIGCERNIYEAAHYYQRALALRESDKGRRMQQELRREYRRRYPNPVIPLPKDRK